MTKGRNIIQARSTQKIKIVPVLLKKAILFFNFFTGNNRLHE